VPEGSCCRWCEGNPWPPSDSSFISEMNRFDSTDSVLSLVRPEVRRYYCRMREDMIQYLILDRCDPNCNMARYYVLAIEPSLFGEATLTREWGRIGQRGQRRVEIYDSYGRAAEELEAWLKRKSGRGYVVRR
jgi:predicted DNA-binding WGR domain protein